MNKYNLSEREKAILRYVIHQFILTALPVGSRNITKKYEIGLSAASVRNIMYDLEEVGLLDHPHTSAGRVPTDLGYRVYVDLLMDPPDLNINEKSLFDSFVSFENFETDYVLKIASKLLSDITSQLVIVSFPNLDDAKLEKIQLFFLSTNRILIVISIDSGNVRTITLELENNIKNDILKNVEALLNERLSGLKFKEIRETFKDRTKDYDKDKFKPIIRLFLSSLDKIFTDVKLNDRTLITGAKNIIKQPEFDDLEKFQSIIELIEDKDVVIHLLDKNKNEEGEFNVVIGMENQDEMLNQYSLVTKPYKLGNTAGTLGIIGPKRMNYSKVIGAAIYVADLITKEYSKK